MEADVRLSVETTLAHGALNHLKAAYDALDHQAWTWCEDCLQDLWDILATLEHDIETGFNMEKHG